MISRHRPGQLAVPSVIARRTLCGALTLACLGLPAARCHAQAQPAANPPAAQAQPAAVTKPAQEDPEIKLGRQAAEENDKHIKLVTDSAILERVNRIGQEIAAVANKMPIPAGFGDAKLKQFNYTFKVVDDKDVNAYSLPGGFIYVNKGLLDYVHSDDELAGVLAHEIGHAAHHHVMKLIHEQKKLESVLNPLQIAALAALIYGKGQGAQAGSSVMYGSQLYATAKVNGYSVEAEKDADHTGLLLLTHTHYNPVGLYTFQIRLAAYERSKIHGELGILRDHPPGPERVAAAKQLLEDLNIPIYISEVDPAWRATVSTEKIGTVEFADVKLANVVICRVIGDEGLTAQQRADRIAKKLTSLFDRQLQPFEIRVNKDQTRVLARGVSILGEMDAAAQSKSIEVLAHEMADAVTIVNQKQQLDTTL
jgi:predicted Zn-dependent protease